jgi:hypothetical protein
LAIIPITRTRHNKSPFTTMLVINDFVRPSGSGRRPNVNPSAGLFTGISSVLPVHSAEPLLPSSCPRHRPAIHIERELAVFLQTKQKGLDSVHDSCG